MSHGRAGCGKGREPWKGLGKHQCRQRERPWDRSKPGVCPAGRPGWLGRMAGHELREVGRRPGDGGSGGASCRVPFPPKVMEATGGSSVDWYNPDQVSKRVVAAV